MSTKRQVSQMDDNKTVTVKPLAYYKMLVHILRFGNKVRDKRQYKEVMGILIGRLEGEKDEHGVQDVIIEDAVPISHGGSIEVAFKQEDYISFSMVDAKYAERDPPLFSVGWYHSHPNLNIFFSSTDIKNQLGWQTPNPSAVGIVFDHTYLENPNDLGFRTFRLDDPSKGPMSAYHEVKTIVEPPDDLDFYIKIMNLIGSIHSKEPPILELNETPDLFGDVIIPGQSQVMPKQPTFQVTDFLSSLKSSLSQFIELSVEPLIRYLNSWTEALTKQIRDTNLAMRNKIVSLKNIIGQGIEKIQNTFKIQLRDKLNEIDIYFDDRFEDFDAQSQAISDALASLTESVTQKIDDLFEEKVTPSVDKLLESFDENEEELKGLNDSYTTYNENLNSQENNIAEVLDNFKEVKESSKANLAELKSSFNVKLEENIGNMESNMLNLYKKFGDLSNNFEIITEFLESAQESIPKKLKELEEENEQLKSEIERLKSNKSKTSKNESNKSETSKNESNNTQGGV
ncbi:MAG: hypothetical protein R6U96_10305 [Promethearchaeia archaeon]